MRILIIEDEIHLADALSHIMQEQKYLVDMVHNGQDGLAYALSGLYDVIILDVMLPGLNGFQVVKELRKAKNATPVLMLTAKDETADKISGLDQGADDYMTKPFVPQELLARVRAISRRQGDVILEEITFADLRLGLSTNILYSQDKQLQLRYKEFEILRVLISNPGITISKETLINKIWGPDSEAEDNNVEAYISFLRKKLAYLGSQANIATIRKVGYRLEEGNKET